jgi:FkbM family methyltransferase
MLIYDFGMNNGGSLKYYLSKGRVVGVEANPKLCGLVSEKFAPEIASGRLTVLNIALAKTEGTIPFYFHKTTPGFSQLPVPADPSQFDRVEVPCRTPEGVIREHGEPSYIKIDLEFYDHVILESLFAAGIFPPEISAEAHTVEVFARLVAAGYTSFALVEGNTPDDSAGPFGEDIPRWEDPDTFLYTLASRGLGWRDIHASKTIQPQPQPRYRTIAGRQALALVKNALRAVREKVV